MPDLIGQSIRRHHIVEKLGEVILLLVVAAVLLGINGCRGIATATPQRTLTNTLGIGSVMKSDKDGMELVYVPAGEFLMGSADSDTFANSDEKPQHKVYLDAYWMDKYEVTNGQYAQCVRAWGCKAPYESKSLTHSSYYGNDKYKDYPVIYVDWNMAKAYCHWAGRRLPTEAQWEKAARGTDGRIYPWGNAPDKSLLNFFSIVGDTTKVGSFPAGAGPYGALDMAGNVQEWVADWYDRSYYSIQNDWRNPSGPVWGQYRVLRGGSWGDVTMFVRSASRDFYDPVDRTDRLGFRCARTP